MLLVGAANGVTNPLSQFIGGEQTITLHHTPLAMGPSVLDGIEPWTLDGKATHQNAHPFLGFRDLAVVLAV